MSWGIMEPFTAKPRVKKKRPRRYKCKYCGINVIGRGGACRRCCYLIDEYGAEKARVIRTAEMVT